MTERSSSRRPDPPALETVWREHGDQFRRRARTRLRQYGLSGMSESMDICNDVMADLARRHKTGVTPDQVLAYILVAIDNQVRDTFRNLARHCRDFRRNEAVPVEDMIVEAAATTPSQIMLRREVIQKVRSMLSDKEAKAVDMMLENRDWKEIGSALGMAPDTIRMKVRRALDKVRRDVGLENRDGLDTPDADRNSSQRLDTGAPNDK